MMKKSIDVNNILYNSIWNNKIIILAIIPLFIAFYLQDTVFSRSVADITRDISGFTKDANITKILIVLLPFIAAIIIFYLTNIVIANKIPAIEMDVTHELTNQMIESAKTSKKKINVNEMMTQIKKVTDAKNIYKVFAAYIIPTIVVTVSLMYNFIKADSKTGLIVVIMILILILATMKLEYSSIDAAYEAEKSSNELYDGIHETMTNIDTVITADTKKKELDNLDKIKDKTYDLTYVSEMKNGNTTYGLQLLSLLTVIGINYISYKLYSKNKISATTLVTIILLTLLFMDYYNYCVSAIKEVISNIGKLYDANEYFSNFEIITDNINKSDLKIIRGGIELKNITLKYDNKYIFENISLRINGNSKVGIVGPIGSGKSSLLKIIAGIVDYDGNIIIDDQNLKNCTYESIAKHIAYISQHPKLFNQTILYNLSYGTNYTENDIINKLNKLGLMDFIDVFPNKLHTIVGKEGSAISGGQKQFISFIRSIIQNKSIILLDEPSSSLDPKSKQILINLIKRLKDKTIIITTHDKDLVPLFDKIIDNLNQNK